MEEIELSYPNKELKWKKFELIYPNKIFKNKRN